MEDSVKRQIEDNLRFRGYEKTITEIYQQVTRDFLMRENALAKTWDEAATKLTSEFSETELRAVRDYYQNHKSDKEFLETQAGRKWHEKVESIIQSAFEHVRHSVFEGSRYETYRKDVDEKIALYESQGKLPAGLVRRDAPPMELKPADSDEPIFRIFEGIPKESERLSFAIDDKKPLLVVSTITDLILAQDGKGVLIRLNEKDTKTFAEITRKFQDKILFVQCTDSLLEGMHITAPIEDGYIGWQYPQSAKVAEYLRKRFRVGEFK
ncbi:MAG TPA: hypothetical protein VMT62_07070 [Syntrophorhabdaceae bacterium]|nr:hypothetical protein [Syntrophorhabdaceae bacterium]